MEIAFLMALIVHSRGKSLLFLFSFPRNTNDETYRSHSWVCRLEILRSFELPAVLYVKVFLVRLPSSSTVNYFGPGNLYFRYHSK